MAGRIKHIEADALDRGQLIALGNTHGDDVGLGLFAHDGDAMGAVAQSAEAGDVIGMQMGVDGFNKPHIKFASS